MIKNVITSTVSAIVALVGTIGGVIWAFKTNWDPEPIILLIISLVELVAFILIKTIGESKGDKTNNGNQDIYGNTDMNSNRLSGNSNVSNSNTINIINSTAENEIRNDRNKTIEDVRPLVSILFIDDDTRWKVIGILKKAGWLRTRIVKDLKNLNEENIINANIVFVDIQGVGKLMGFDDEGLGLAASIKERYPKKKVIIYSADAEGSRFHRAFRLADDQLAKGAVPYEFESVIETMTTQLIKDGLL